MGVSVVSSTSTGFKLFLLVVVGENIVPVWDGEFAMTVSDNDKMALINPSWNTDQGV
jgi:hypothetical protein